MRAIMLVSASFMDQVLPAQLYVGLAGLPVMASGWERGRWRCQVTLRTLFLSFSVPLAEASPGSWWNPTGRSRRQARNSRSSLLAQTGNVRLEGAAASRVRSCSRLTCLCLAFSSLL